MFKMFNQFFKRKKALKRFLLGIPPSRYEKFLTCCYQLNNIDPDNENIYIQIDFNLFFGCDVYIKKKYLDENGEFDYANTLTSYSYLNNTIKNHILKKDKRVETDKKSELSGFFDYIDAYNTDFYDNNKPFV